MTMKILLNTQGFKIAFKIKTKSGWNFQLNWDIFMKYIITMFKISKFSCTSKWLVNHAVLTIKWNKYLPEPIKYPQPQLLLNFVSSSLSLHSSLNLRIEHTYTCQYLNSVHTNSRFINLHVTVNLNILVCKWYTVDS